MTGDRPEPAAMRSTAPPAAGPRPDGPLSFGTVVAEESRYLELADDAPRAALCLSGGGIRSAAFAMGVVTGLARAGVLDAFHYLSTVSGGGYTGSWLSAWFQRAGGRRPVLDALRQAATATPAEPPTRARGPRPAPDRDTEPAAVRHVRAYCSYLSPRYGLMSADAWTVLGTYVRNLVITAVVLVPLIAAVLLLPVVNAAFVLALHRCLGPSDGAARCGPLTADAVSVGLYTVSGVLSAVAIAALRVQRENRRLRATVGGDDDVGDEGPAATPGGRPRSRRPILALVDGGDVDLVLFFVLPFVVAALLLVGRLMTLDPWAPVSDAVVTLAAWGGAVHFGGWLLGGLGLRMAGLAPIGARWRLRLGEVVAVVVTGAIGGVACLYLARRLLGAPLADLELPLAFTQAMFGAPLLMLAGLIAATVFVGAASLFSSDDDREFWARAGSWFLMAIAALLVLHAIALVGPMLVARLRHLPVGTILTTWGVVSGGLTALAGFSPSGGRRDPAAGESSRSKTAFDVLAAVAAPLFLLQVLVVVAVANAYAVDHFAALSSWPRLIAAVVGLAAFALLIGRLVKLDAFSLHAFYRNRLVRTFLGASRADDAGRRPDAFTGFDPDDDVPMRALVAEGAPDEPPRLLHVLNLALNIGRGAALADQHRKAIPFTVTGLHCGADRLGYRRSGPAPAGIGPALDAAGRDDDDPTPAPGPAKRRAAMEARARQLLNFRQEGDFYGGPEPGLLLGTAMTISGAAASPNMGYHSSPVVTFLLALLNVRLGRWLGNPGPAGEGTFRLSGPRVSSLPLIQEAFQLTGTDRPFVFLSDGGHFENLGLYEMVRRRCQLIVVADASADPKYLGGDLARAVQLVRLDFGVRITFHDPSPALADRTAPESIAGRGHHDLGTPEPANAAARSPWRARVGTIHYAERFDGAGDGVVLVLKPAVFSGDPVDVRNERNRSKRFPHESTANQWFSESQFEAYRMLGEHTVACLSAAGGAPDVAAARAQGIARATSDHLAAWFASACRGAIGCADGDASPVDDALTALAAAR